jgi:site-specific DNA recombinase
MPSCVIYARVSTKEQQEEGYSIPAQLKAMRAFCEAEKLTPLAEFIETESAGHAGRTQFGRMLEFLRINPQCRVVVAHKLDRLYRNFTDQVALEEELGVRSRYVLGDVPDTPQGALIRDVQLSVSKFYLGNLAEEVRKGMEEKVAQGGWGHKAPIGYLNDKNTRTVVVDSLRAPLVAWAFERYASGVVSVAQLSRELESRGLVRKNGSRLLTSALHQLLRNPFYCGRMRYKGELYPGAHTQLISVALFERVQERLADNRIGPKVRQKKVYSLRGTMRCDECGCLITAGTHKEHVYYRCTHGKGSCSQKSYVREDVLSSEIEELLSRIEIGQEVIEALVADCEALLKEKSAELAQSHDAARSEIEAARGREKKLLDAYLDGAVPVEVYRERAEELSASRRALELRIKEQVRDLALVASSARIRFQDAADEGKREVVQTVLCNLGVQEGHIASYQYKDPFGLLEMESSGAFKNEWWAILDLNQ